MGDYKVEAGDYAGQQIKLRVKDFSGSAISVDDVGLQTVEFASWSIDGNATTWAGSGSDHYAAIGAGSVTSSAFTVPNGAQNISVRLRSETRHSCRPCTSTCSAGLASPPSTSSTTTRTCPRHGRPAPTASALQRAIGQDPDGTGRRLGCLGRRCRQDGVAGPSLGRVERRSDREGQDASGSSSPPWTRAARSGCARTG